MNVQTQIKDHLASISGPKRSEMETLHQLILRAQPKTKQWFDNGKNEDDKTVANPTIGYGSHTIKYADGKTKDFFRVGISANQTGISVYIIGMKDKTYLAQTYGKKLGNAKITGYCIKFKTIKDINLDVLEEAIQKMLQTPETA